MVTPRHRMTVTASSRQGGWLTTKRKYQIGMLIAVLFSFLAGRLSTPDVSDETDILRLRLERLTQQKDAEIEALIQEHNEERASLKALADSRRREADDLAARCNSELDRIGAQLQQTMRLLEICQPEQR